MKKLPVLLDTDPGNDIDDALAMAYLARNSNCELLGITTVSGDVAQRAAIAELVLRAAGREDVPIVAGRSEPLTHGPGQPGCRHFPAVAHLPHRDDYPANEAVDFLRSQIRSRPHEIHLLSIGPMSNIGALFALDPEIPSLLAGLTSMAGFFFDERKNEWNMRCDPIAAAIVADQAVPGHRWIGLDVTLKCQRSKEELYGDFAAPEHEVIRLMSQKWFEHDGAATFHDPLAAVTLFHPEVCTYEQGTVKVDFATGDTTFTPGDSPHSVAKTVSVRSFFDEYLRL